MHAQTWHLEHSIALSATSIANFWNFTRVQIPRLTKEDNSLDIPLQGGGQSAPQAPQLNTNISQFESYIYNVFLYPVNKGEALKYLDENGPLPKRFATVIAVRGAEEPPDVMEYKASVPRNALMTQLDTAHARKRGW